MIKYLTILLLIPFFSFSQPLLEKTTISEQLEDFEILKTTLLENHTGLYDYTDSISLNNSFLKLKKDLSIIQPTLNQVALYKKFITSINCIHTNVGRKNLKKDLNKFKYALPFSTYFINGKLYATSKYENDIYKITKQDEIIEINGESVTSLTSHLYQYIPSDGRNTTRKNQVLKNHYFLYYFIYKQKESEYHLKYIHEGDTLKNEFPNQYPISQSNRKKKINKSITYSIDSLKSYAILTPPYPLPNSSKYKKELDVFFTSIKSKKINTLIIDLRNNGGGRSQEYLAGFFSFNSYCMMTHTSNESSESTYKKHFKHRFSLNHIIGRLSGGMSTSTVTAISHPNQFNGKLSVLINGNTASAASNLASSLKEWSNASLVGEESGGGYKGCNSGNLVLELPNSKIQVLINVFKAMNTTMNTYENDGVSPHFHILESSNFNATEDLQLNYIIDKL